VKPFACLPAGTGCNTKDAGYFFRLLPYCFAGATAGVLFVHVFWQPVIIITAPRAITNAASITTHFAFILFSLTTVSIQFILLPAHSTNYRTSSIFSNTLYAEILSERGPPNSFIRDLGFNNFYFCFAILLFDF
jgi:hypothetical protein